MVCKKRGGAERGTIETRGSERRSAFGEEPISRRVKAMRSYTRLLVAYLDIRQWTPGRRASQCFEHDIACVDCGLYPQAQVFAPIREVSRCCSSPTFLARKNAICLHIGSVWRVPVLQAEAGTEEPSQSRVQRPSLAVSQRERALYCEQQPQNRVNGRVMLSRVARRE